MKENEQTKKTLGEILYDAEEHRAQISPTKFMDVKVGWENITQGYRDACEKAASAVEQAVLERRGLVTTEAKAEPEKCPECGIRIYPDMVHTTCNPFLTPEELRAMLGGRTAHREDGWRRDWLTDGWRPVIMGEKVQSDDEYHWNGIEWRRFDMELQWAESHDCHFHRRTRRELPLPPTTEQKPEGEAQRAFETPQSESPPQHADVPHDVKFPTQTSGDGTSSGRLSIFARGWNGCLHEIQKLNPHLTVYRSGIDVSRDYWDDLETTALEQFRKEYDALRKLFGVPWEEDGPTLLEALTAKHAEMETLTKERDEAKGLNRRLDIEYTRRAEQAEKQVQELTRDRDAARIAVSESAQKAAQLLEENCQLAARLVEVEKKLAEVEQVIGSAQAGIDIREARISELSQKLQQAEASARRWTMISDRVPTIKDADKNGFVWALAKDEVFAEVPWNVSYMDRLLCWMTPIPLPAPTEEKDAFKVWMHSTESSFGEPFNLAGMRRAFEAGRQSATPQ